MHDFRLRKVSPAKQLLIQHVGFVNSRHFLQHQSLAKHWFKNLKILALFCLTQFFHVPNIMLTGTSVNTKVNLLNPRALFLFDDVLLEHCKFSTKYLKSVISDFLNILKIKSVFIIFKCMYSLKMSDEGEIRKHVVMSSS